MPDQKLAYPLREAAAMVSLSEDYLRRATKRTEGNHLPAQKVGKKYLIRHEDLAAWISREGEPA